MILKNRAIPTANIKLLIFDLDGTLVDSRIDLANSINAMLRNYGKHELPNEVIASYIGDGAPMLVRRALGDPDDEVYDGVMQSLESIRARYNGAAKMAVLSNKPVGPSRAIVEALDLGKYFFQVYGGNSFHTKKPDPAGVEALLQEAGVGADQTVIIGDSDVDVVTGRNSGIYSIGVKYGLAPHTLAEAPPDVLVDEPIEVGRVFEGGN